MCFCGYSVIFQLFYSALTSIVLLLAFKEGPSSLSDTIEHRRQACHHPLTGICRSQSGHNLPLCKFQRVQAKKNLPKKVIFESKKRQLHLAKETYMYGMLLVEEGTEWTSVDKERENQHRFKYLSFVVLFRMRFDLQLIW